MPREILYFHFNVIDMDRAISFYTKVFGATIVEHTFPVWARLQLGSAEIGLLVTDTKAPYI